MGYGEYGGGGSISWKVDVDDTDPNRKGKKRAAMYGYDPKDAPTFTVTLEYGTPQEAAADLARLQGAGGMRATGNTITFTMPVQRDNDNQIRIEW